MLNLGRRNSAGPFIILLVICFFMILAPSVSTAQVNPYVGEIRMFAGNFPPKGWAFCNGQLLPISLYTPLFSLIGTYYGGDGQTNFALPNLQGRVPIHQGQGGGLSPRFLGQMGGTETETLTIAQIPAHSHLPNASSAAGNTSAPAANVWTAGKNSYSTAAPDVSLAADALSATGGSQPHNNMQPYLVISFIIALEGIFPTQN